MEASEISDEMLTAFLDGEADPATSKIVADLIETDPALAARLDALEIPLATIREAFDRAMEAAPSATLNELLESQPQEDVGDDRSPRLKNRSPWLTKGLQLAMAASVLAFAVGLTTGRLTLPPDSSDDWRVAVAEYQALYAQETLESVDLAPAVAEETIRSVAAKVGAPILPETLASLDQLTFKRAQILRWEKAPLGQFAFLSSRGEPFALCITPVTGGDQPIEGEEMKGLATSSWVNEGIAYMVIGGRDLDFAVAVAEQVRARL